MSRNGTIRTIVVDDEPLARQRLRKLLKGHPDIDLIAECANGPEAIAAISEHAPDLLFLDVEMPEVDGFEVLRAVSPGALPLVVFVTAHQQYAVKAFDVRALDYLLKPFDRERFETAIGRAKQRLRDDVLSEATRQVRALLDEVPSRSGWERIVVRSAGRVLLLPIREIDWVEAEAKYVRVHAGADAYLVRQAIGTLARRLDSRQFVRIHRSTIVNLERVKMLEPWFHGDYRVVLHDGTRLTLSRGCRKNLASLLNPPL
jgi:two-component system LytT family response regulator